MVITTQKKLSDNHSGITILKWDDLMIALFMKPVIPNIYETHWSGMIQARPWGAGTYVDVSGAATCLDCALVAFSERWDDGTMVEFLAFLGSLHYPL